MKKTASILLLLAMVFSLAACASKPKDNGFSADLSDFYANNFSGDDVPAMEQLQDDETIESLYPGAGPSGAEIGQNACHAGRKGL